MVVLVCHWCPRCLSFFSAIISFHSEIHLMVIIWAAKLQSEHLCSKQKEGGKAKGSCQLNQSLFKGLAWKTQALLTSSVEVSCSVVSNCLRPHEPQHTRPPCLSSTPGVHPHPCASSQWCHPIISSSVVPFSSLLQSFPASGSFQMSQLFASVAKVLEFQL